MSWTVSTYFWPHTVALLQQKLTFSELFLPSYYFGKPDKLVGKPVKLSDITNTIIITQHVSSLLCCTFTTSLICLQCSLWSAYFRANRTYSASTHQVISASTASQCLEVRHGSNAAEVNRAKRKLQDSIRL